MHALPIVFASSQGAVVAVAVATLREVATVILSYIVYPKVFSVMHAISALLVLAGILLTMTCTASSNEITNTNNSTGTTISSPTRTMRSRLELSIANKS